MRGSNQSPTDGTERKYSLIAAWRHARSGALCVLLLFVLAAPGVCKPVPEDTQAKATGNPTNPNQLYAAPSQDYNNNQGKRDGGQQGTGGTVTVYQPPPLMIWDPGFGPANCTTDRPENPADQLDKNGPVMPTLFSMSAFTLRGFTKGGWPVAVDYVLPQDSLVLMVIAPDEQPPITYRLHGKQGHWIAKLIIPDSVGPELRIAQYSLQTLDDKDNSLVSPSQIYIHGMAAGPKAVGSIGIDHLTFQPDSIVHAQNQKAEYSYHSIADFDETEVSFVRLGKSNGRELRAVAVANKSMGPIAQNGSKNGDWDGSVDKRLIKSYKNPELQQWLQSPDGKHALQVKAWFRKKNGGDFVAAFSDTWVTVQ